MQHSPGQLTKQAHTFWSPAWLSGVTSRAAQPPVAFLPQLVPSLTLSPSSDCARPDAASVTAAAAAAAGARPLRPGSAPCRLSPASLGSRAPRRRLAARSTASFSSGTDCAGPSAFRRLTMPTATANKPWCNRNSQCCSAVLGHSSPPSPTCIGQYRLFSLRHRVSIVRTAAQACTRWLYKDGCPSLGQQPVGAVEVRTLERMVSIAHAARLSCLRSLVLLPPLVLPAGRQRRRQVTQPAASQPRAQEQLFLPVAGALHRTSCTQWSPSYPRCWAGSRQAGASRDGPPTVAAFPLLPPSFALPPSQPCPIASQSHPQ